jgi:hypothetical protein
MSHPQLTAFQICFNAGTVVISSNLLTDWNWMVIGGWIIAR